MSTTATPRAGVWVSSLLGGLVLYVATWPPVEIKSTFRTTVTTTSGSSMQIVTSYYRPAWPDVVYAPLRSLSERDGGANVLCRYYIWWTEVLGAPSPFPF